jgi:PAS domain S-box-containing protein
MTEGKRSPSYEELKQRLTVAEAALQALREGQVDSILGERGRLVVRLAEAQAREAHIKRVLLAIRNVNHLIVREKNVDRLIEQACLNLAGTDRYHGAWLVLLDREGVLVGAAEAGLGGDFAALRERFQEGDLPPCGAQALAEPDVVVIDEATSVCKDCPLAIDHAAHNAMTVQLRHTDRVHGLITVFASDDLAADTEEQALLKELAEDIGFAVHSIELEEARQRAETALRRKNRALRVLSRTNAALIRCKTVSDLCQAACRVAVEEGGYRLAWVGFAEHDEAKSVRPIAQSGFEEGYLATLDITWADTKRGQGPAGTAMRTNKPAVARDIPTDPAFAPWRQDALQRGYMSSIALPVTIGEEVWGSFNIYAAEPDAFDEEEVRLLQELANDLGYGIYSLRIQAERTEVLAALQKSESLLSRAETLAGFGSWEWDFEADGLTASVGWQQIHGCRQSQLSREELLPIAHPDDRAEVEAALQRTQSQGEPYELEHRIIRQDDGDVRVIKAYGQVVQDETGKTIRFYGAAQDITLQKQAEEELRAHREHLEKLVDERTSELRTLVNAMTGREIRMAELKDVIRALRSQLYDAGLTPIADDPLLGSEAP